jgi:predicted nuclease of predicted toxin-antitoxin system
VKFKIDENLPQEFAELLCKASHDAESVFDEGLVGEADSTIIDVCKIEERCLITLDLDFSDMRTYPPSDLPGLIVLRLRNQDKFSVVALVPKLVELFNLEKVTGRLWIVEEDRVRIRGEE